MEYGLRGAGQVPTGLGWYVLILVLMEYGLRDVTFWPSWLYQDMS